MNIILYGFILFGVIIFLRLFVFKRPFTHKDYEGRHPTPKEIQLMFNQLVKDLRTLPKDIRTRQKIIHLMELNWDQQLSDRSLATRVQSHEKFKGYMHYVYEFWALKDSWAYLVVFFHYPDGYELDDSLEPNNISLVLYPSKTDWGNYMERNSLSDYKLTFEKLSKGEEVIAEKHKVW